MSEIKGDYNMSDGEKDAIEILKKSYFEKFGVMPKQSAKNWAMPYEEQIIEAIASGDLIDSSFDEEVLY